ncbi:protein HEXIM1-like protein [Leptotrombidium deliense]|uniref:Protein HEXIM1-like protein n=1 Tax=Leptotrombidium deliense TaxID=299467 RepID=A0A443RZP4_9ACAR|nr:protein HEXIM1-like protein [Leptotrombidium deliense]
MSTLCEVVSKPVFTRKDAIITSNDDNSESQRNKALRHECAHDSKYDVSCAHSVTLEKNDTTEHSLQTVVTAEEQSVKSEQMREKEPKRRKSRTRKTKFWRRKPFHKYGSTVEKSKGYFLPTNVQREKPLAPFNTTQFLMDDHNVREPEFAEIHKLLHNNHSESRQLRQNENANNINDESDQFYSSPDDEQDFIQKQFLETYENVHTERLNSMSKSELVQEYMALEERMEELERKLKDSSSEVQTSLQKNEGQLKNDDSSDESISESLQDEVNRLQEENKKLLSNNEKLMYIINSNCEIARKSQ